MYYDWDIQPSRSPGREREVSPLLYTLTPNPAIDMNLTAGPLLLNRVNRTSDAVYTPNGKGLNVSFTLSHYGVPSGILGFFGGFSGEYIVDQCRLLGQKICPVSIEGTTRINVFVSSGPDECKLVCSGPEVSPAEQEELLRLLSGLEDADVLTVNGSSCRGLMPDFYRRVFAICREKQVPVVLDMSSPAVKELLPLRPLLIKPNDEELWETFGLPSSTPEEVLSSVKTLHGMGASNILLTLGEKGSYFYNGEALYFSSAVPVTLKSSACAGDACLAAFLSLWLEHPEAPEQALIRASAAGACVAESDGLGDFAHTAAYEAQVTVTRIV